MGTVWAARHEKLGTEVVVKLLTDALSSSDEARTRFAREVTTTVSVRSPHIVQILDHGLTEAGTPFLVMELLEGRDLAAALRAQGRLEPAEAVHVIRGVAAALARVHERGIVHRDIKPANVFLCNDVSPLPFVKLVDFGIAKRLEDASVTATDALVGTPSYMSPEQLRGDPIDHRTDLWALGVLAFHVLTGTPPFGGPSVPATIHAVVYGELPRPTNYRADLPPDVDAWCERALCRDPAGRFFDAREMAAELELALGELAMPPSRHFLTGPLTPPRLPVSGPQLPSASSLATGDEAVTLHGTTAMTSPPPSRRWLLGVGAIALAAVGVSVAMHFGEGGLAERDRQAGEPPASPTAPSLPIADTVPPDDASTSAEIVGAPKPVAVDGGLSVSAPARPAASLHTAPRRTKARASTPGTNPPVDDIGF